MTSLGFARARSERLVEGAIGRGDVQVSIKNDECAGHGLNDVACRNIGYCHCPLIDSAASKLRREQSCKAFLELMLRVGLAQELRAFNKHRSHFVGDQIAGRVEHAQFRPKPDGLLSSTRILRLIRRSGSFS